MIKQLVSETVQKMSHMGFNVLFCCAAVSWQLVLHCSYKIYQFQAWNTVYRTNSLRPGVTKHGHRQHNFKLSRKKSDIVANAIYFIRFLLPRFLWIMGVNNC